MPIFAPLKHIIMVQDVGLNQAQMDFLRLLSHFKTEEEVRVERSCLQVLRPKD
jgi:hypothetical protein